MGKNFTMIAAGIAIALVLTAAFQKGTTTVKGISALGGMTNDIFQGAEGKAASN